MPTSHTGVALKPIKAPQSNTVKPITAPKPPRDMATKTIATTPRNHGPSTAVKPAPTFKGESLYHLGGYACLMNL